MLDGRELSSKEFADFRPALFSDGDIKYFIFFDFV